MKTTQLFQHRNLTSNLEVEQNLDIKAFTSVIMLLPSMECQVNMFHNLELQMNIYKKE